MCYHALVCKKEQGNTLLKFLSITVCTHFRDRRFADGFGNRPCTQESACAASMKGAKDEG